MDFLKSYTKLPWIVQSTVPIAGIAGVILKLHQIFHFNFMEFLGVTFSVISSFYILFHTYRFIYQNWIGVFLDHYTDLTKLGSWAIVTGCTQGIGRAYVDALAKLGLNVVLIARSPDKLEQVAKEVREMYKVDVKIISVDFTKGKEIYDEIEKGIENLEVGVLINNVGMCYAYPEYYADLPNVREFTQDLINCNMLSVSLMTAVVLPGMLRRGKGAVVSVGSITCQINTPFMTLYGSSKAFVDRFTLDMDLEYGDKGIIFQSLIPGYIMTSMSKKKESSLFVPTPEEFVEKAMKTIGLQKRTAVWLPHELLYFCVHIGWFFRRDGAALVTHYISQQFWYYGKKVMIYRNKKA